jgi:ribosome-associated protein
LTWKFRIKYHEGKSFYFSCFPAFLMIIFGEYFLLIVSSTIAIMSTIVIDPITLDDSEIQFDFIHASGPGGQNVNKLASAVQLRFDVLHSPSLPDDVRLRLLKIAGRRINNQGVLVIESKAYRTQEQNKQEALRRLEEIVSQAIQPPKPRHKTKPTLASKLRRLETKRHRSQVKLLRHKYHHEDE